MTFKTKLLITFFVSTTISVGVSLLLLNRVAEEGISEELHAKTLSLAVTVAALLDGDLHTSIPAENPEESSAYKHIREQLRAVHRLNQRQDTVVGRVYTLVQSEAEPGILRYGVDSEDASALRFSYGTVFHGKSSQPVVIGERSVESGAMDDEIGRWIMAWAPVYNSAGKAVAAVVVDLPAARTIVKTHRIHQYGLIALGIGLVSAMGMALILSRKFSRPLAEIVDIIHRIGGGDFNVVPEHNRSDEFAAVSRELSVMAHGLRERETVKAAFSRYVSHQVLDSVLHSGATPTLSGVRRRVTVLFCDIRNFTTLSEKLRPEEVVEILNEFFEHVVAAVFKHNGTLDKFIGDGLMAIFGAPVEDSYQEEHAVRAALEIQREVAALSQRIADNHGVLIKAGIGINSGNAIVGNIGSSQRLEYTAIGDTVNLASRLESATKDLGVDIVLSEFTNHALRGTLHTTHLGPITVKGKQDVVQAYTVQNSQ